MQVKLWTIQIIFVAQTNAFSPYLKCIFKTCLKLWNLPMTVLVSSVTTSWAVLTCGGSEGVSRLLDWMLLISSVLGRGFHRNLKPGLHELAWIKSLLGGGERQVPSRSKSLPSSKHPQAEAGQPASHPGARFCCSSETRWFVGLEQLSVLLRAGWSLGWKTVLLFWNDVFCICQILMYVFSLVPLLYYLLSVLQYHVSIYI